MSGNLQIQGTVCCTIVPAQNTAAGRISSAHQKFPSKRFVIGAASHPLQLYSKKLVFIEFVLSIINKGNHYTNKYTFLEIITL